MAYATIPGIRITETKNNGVDSQTFYSVSVVIFLAKKKVSVVICLPNFINLALILPYPTHLQFGCSLLLLCPGGMLRLLLRC
jgi:hypothetical protein